MKRTWFVLMGPRKWCGGQVWSLDLEFDTCDRKHLLWMLSKLQLKMQHSGPFSSLGFSDGRLLWQQIWFSFTMLRLVPIRQLHYPQCNTSPASKNQSQSFSICLIFTLRHEEIKKPLRRIYRAGPSPPVNHVNVSTPSLQATNHQMRETFHHTSATLPAGLEWDFLARVLFNVALRWWISFICLSALLVYRHFLMKTSSLHSLLIWTMAASKPNGWIPVQFRI